MFSKVIKTKSNEDVYIKIKIPQSLTLMGPRHILHADDKTNLEDPKNASLSTSSFVSHLAYTSSVKEILQQNTCLFSQIYHPSLHLG